MDLEMLTDGYDSEYEMQLSAERMETLERDIQQDERPIKFEKDESHLSVQEREKKKLKRSCRLKL